MSEAHIFVMVHRHVCNDGNVDRTIKYSFYKSRQEAVEAIIEDAYIDDSLLEEKVKLQECFFHWEWKRRGNYDAWYIIPANDDYSFEDDIDIDQRFKSEIEGDD